MADIALERSSIKKAREKIVDHIHLTPVLTSRTLNDIISTPQTSHDLKGTTSQGHPPARPNLKLFFKCENFQKIGAFKIRGASHALSRLSRQELDRGVVTHSSGNHAQALALAAKRFGTTAHIVMPTISTPAKIAGTRAHGPEIYFSGSTEQERVEVANSVIEKTGAVFIPPFDHPHIILGQGTMALELEDQVAELVAKDPSLSVHPALPWSSNGQGKGDGNIDCTTAEHRGPESFLDAVLAPLGGGGMLGGIATALAPTPTLVFGAEPSFEGADDGRRGLAADQRIETVKSLTIADGLRTPVGKLNWDIISDKAKVEEVYSVSEEQIKRAMRLVMERLKIVIEPSAAVGVAVAMFDEGFRARAQKAGGWNVGIIISGGNVGMEALGHILAEGTNGSDANGAEREKGTLGSDGAKMAENVPG